MNIPKIGEIVKRGEYYCDLLILTDGEVLNTRDVFEYGTKKPIDTIIEKSYICWISKKLDEENCFGIKTESKVIKISKYTLTHDGRDRCCYNIESDLEKTNS